MKSTRPLCSIPGCTKKLRARGWCTAHYVQWQRTGDPIPSRDYCSSPAERMARWSHPSGDCQVWTGYKNKLGYGLINVEGKQVLVHCYVWAKERGPVPRGKRIDHRCHNEACHRLGHLRLVTNKENSENRRGAQRNSSTGIRGVYCRRGRWYGQVKHAGKSHCTRRFDTPEEAELAVIALRLELFTHSDGR